MKKIMVLSDTHMPRYSKKIPRKILQYLEDIDLIIHAGDFQRYEIYQQFCQYKEVIAVHGNNDDKKLIEVLPRKTIIDIEKIKIGLFHGHGLKIGTNKNTNSINRSIQEFKDDEVNLIIFGHSHTPIIKVVNDITLINPGSPTNKRRQPYYSFGILMVDGFQFEFKHIFFEDKIGYD